MLQKYVVSSKKTQIFYIKIPDTNGGSHGSHTDEQDNQNSDRHDDSHTDENPDRNDASSSDNNQGEQNNPTYNNNEDDANDDYNVQTTTEFDSNNERDVTTTPYSFVDGIRLLFIGTFVFCLMTVLLAAQY